MQDVYWSELGGKSVHAWHEVASLARVLGVWLAELATQERLLPGDALDVADRGKYQTRRETEHISEPEANACEHQDRTRVRGMAYIPVWPTYDELVVYADLKVARELLS